MLGNDIKFDIHAKDKTGRAFDSAGRRMKKLSDNAKFLLGSLSAVGVAGFMAAAKRAVDYGSALTDAAAATRVGVEEYQVLKYAAQQAGADMNKLTQALAKIQKATNDAANGLTTYTRAFDELGIEVDAFQQLSPERQIEELGRAMVGAKDQAKAYASVLDIIGSRNAPRLMEVLRKLGVEGFDQMEASARKAGQIMEDEVAQKMDKAADAIERFNTQWTIMVGKLAANVATPAMDVFSDFYGGSFTDKMMMSNPLTYMLMLRNRNKERRANAGTASPSEETAAWAKEWDAKFGWLTKPGMQRPADSGITVELPDKLDMPLFDNPFKYYEGLLADKLPDLGLKQDSEADSRDQLYAQFSGFSDLVKVAQDAAAVRAEKQRERQVKEQEETNQLLTLNNKTLSDFTESFSIWK